MAKTVQLNQGPKPNPTQGMTVPPSATQQLRKQPPLPVGKAVAVPVGNTPLTELERATLTRVGWKEGMPIPKNMAQIVAQAEADAQREAAAAARRIPVPPDTPPIEFKPMDIGELSPQQQLEVQRKIDEAIRQQQISKLENTQPLDPSKLTVTRSVDAPVEPLPVPPANFKIDRDYQRTQAPAEAPEPPPSAPVTTATADDVPDVQEHLGEIVSNCPHCGWNLSMADIPEPDYAEKMRFSASFVGRRVYTKSYDLLNSEVSVTFRTLTAREIDACYRQAYMERDTGKITTAMDFIERVNRFRVYLQLLKFGAVELPDGLTRRDNPNASAFWEVDEATLDKLPHLVQIEEYVLSSVLTSESLLRVVNQLCIGFNRLVAKLEAMVERSDFWQPTSLQP